MPRRANTQFFFIPSRSQIVRKGAQRTPLGLQRARPAVQTDVQPRAAAGSDAARDHTIRSRISEPH